MVFDHIIIEFLVLYFSAFVLVFPVRFGGGYPHGFRPHNH
jgi:hypothetical protein